METGKNQRALWPGWVGFCLITLGLALGSGCSESAGPTGADSGADVKPATDPGPAESTDSADTAPAPDATLADLDIKNPQVQAGVEVTADSFRCLADMTRVRHFFVDNLLGDLDSTVAVANSPTGGTYPPGSVVQLVPTEVMVKHKPGWNAATRDWEFFELVVEDGTTTIDKRGFVDVVNKFGGNCFACHVKAEPQWDLICEQGHGCDPIPVTREQIAEIQQADPRCAG